MVPVASSFSPAMPVGSASADPSSAGAAGARLGFGGVAVTTVTGVLADDDDHLVVTAGSNLNAQQRPEDGPPVPQPPPQKGKLI